MSDEDANALWAALNACNPTPEVDTSLTGTTIYRHIDCGNYREVLLYAVHEGGHNPGYTTDGRPLEPPGGPSGLFELMWEFFERNARP